VGSARFRINVENAWPAAHASSGCGDDHGGCLDVVLALGVMKLYSEDRKKSFAAISGAVDVELMQMINGGSGSMNAAASGASAGAGGAGESARCSWTSTPAVARPTAALRHHRRAVRHGLGEELISRQPQSTRPVSRDADGRAGSRRADDRRAADTSDVLAIGDGAAAVVW